MERSFLQTLFFRNIWFVFLFAWLEIIFHLAFFHNAEVLLPLVMSLPIAFLCSVLTHLARPNVNRILGFLMTAFVCFFFDAEAIYYTVFHTFMAPFSLISMVENAFNFRSVAIAKALTQIPLLILLNLPLVLYWIVTIPSALTQRLSLSQTARTLLCCICLQLVAVGSLFLYGTDYYSPYDLYYRRFLINDSIQSLGVTTSVRLDAAEALQLRVPQLKRRTIVPQLFEGILAAVSSSDSPLFEQTENTKKPSSSSESNDKEVARHELDYDFAALAQEAPNSTVEAIHLYMNDQTAEPLNDYSGQFEGYHLIWIMAESLWTYAIRPDLTPTLYQMANEGFVFEHFYTPLWYGSTIGGEFASFVSLVPIESGRFSFDLTGERSNDMRTVLSMKLPSMGYSVGGYHNYLFSFYNRDKSHPNMGMPWWGWQNGYIPETNEDGSFLWPQSDLKLMEDTIDFYIDSETPFFTYYMSFSGHANYGLNGENAMSVKNWDAVADLDYSETARCYLAANIELEKAVSYLIEQLEEHEILEKTLFVISPDHFPYTDKAMCDDLAGHELEEVMEWAENSLIVWSASMEEPVVVEKYCSSLDILPTLCNLLGVTYDSRLLMGHDILGDSPQLVLFPDHSWISDLCIYHADTESVELFSPETVLDSDYIDEMNRIVRQKFQISEDIVMEDYYQYLPED